MQWSLSSKTTPSTTDELRQVLLENRSITSDLEATFFSPIHPMELSTQEVGIADDQLSTAIARIAQAKKEKHKVIVFGDYDADGICATAILWEVLHAAGCDALPFIPDRAKHGYGISQKAIKDILAQTKPDLIITVDNGIVAHEVINQLTADGIDVIVTDHHSPDEQLPHAVAVVHTTQLCGATVAWMLGRTIAEEIIGDVQVSKQQLELCGIATVADQVPLLGANRSLAKVGIAAIASTKRPGLLALLQNDDGKQRDITSATIHFSLAPKINAMGRLEHGMDALRLLCTTSTTRAEELASTLTVTNARRQDLTYELVHHAKRQAEQQLQEHILIVQSPDYHEGVIGLIAGRLAEEYYKPVIALSVGDDIAKASARSVTGVNIVDILRLVRDDLIDVGGHPMAAGFTVDVSKLDVVAQRLAALTKERIDPALLVPRTELECLLDPSLVKLETAQSLLTFGPFGTANPEPLFGLQNMEVVQSKTIGKDNAHLKLLLNLGQAKPVQCLAWRMGNVAADIPIGSRIDLAVSLEINDWKGRQSVQLVAKDVVVK